jgi:hypothetical protein
MWGRKLFKPFANNPFGGLGVWNATTSLSQDVSGFSSPCRICGSTVYLKGHLLDLSTGRFDDALRKNGIDRLVAIGRLAL